MSERTSYLTAAEVSAAKALPRDAPYALCEVSRGFFSLARVAGGCRYQGYDYTYIDGHDECVRDDVLKLVHKLRKQKPAAETGPGPRPVQGGLFVVGDD